MTRRVEITALESGWLVKAWAQTEAEAFALQSALVGVPPAKSFTPGLCAGEAFDAPEVGVAIDPLGGFHPVRMVSSPPEEPWPSDATARTYPPNCDGPPSGYAEPSVGEVLAQAQHVAAEEGEGCTSTVCAMTRGSGD